MPPEPDSQPTAGILIALDALIVQRADQPVAIDEAPVALRRIGWIGRPIILVGKQVAGRDLPADEREAMVAKLTTEEARGPFDMSVGPLIRGRLLALAAGEHVLLIVNEQRRVVRPDAAAAANGSTASGFTGDSPGVDLGVLQALVTECGGHLWMRAEPPGDMELKIHLPRRVLDIAEQPAPAIPSGRSRWIRRAFGSRH